LISKDDSILNADLKLEARTGECLLRESTVQRADMAFKDRLFIILQRSDCGRLLLILLGTFIAGLLEMIGFGTIPAFVGLLIDPERLFSLLPASVFTDAVRRLNTAALVLGGAGLLGGVFVLKNFFIVTLVYAEAHLAQSLNASISTRLFDAYLRSPYSFLLQRNPSELIRNLTDDAVYASQYIKALMHLVREVVVSVCILLLMVLVEPVVSLTVFSLFALATASFYLLVHRVLVRRGRLCEAHWSRRVQIITQTFGAVKDAKILGRESHLVELFGKEVRDLQRHETFYDVVSTLPKHSLEALAVLTVFPVAAAFLLLGKPLPSMLPVLALYGVAVMRLVPAMSAINAVLVEIRYRQPAFDLVCAELNSLTNAIVPQPTKPAGHRRIKKLQDAVCLENVHYRYPGAFVDAVCGISLTINAARTVAFIGTSGAGKSTVIDIILGLLTPTSGHVFVDGRDIQDDLPAWQRQIGYVPQDIYLIDDSIRRNIAFGISDADIDDLAVARAVEAAQIESLIQSLPQGLETPVGHEGVRLSGGQRQRIAIARALYHDPSVLVMDEATNALDEETEYDVMDGVRKLHGDKTVIIVAHRRSTIEGCDRVFRFEDGRLVQEHKMAAAR